MSIITITYIGNLMSLIQVQCKQNNAYVNWLEQIPTTLDGQDTCNFSTNILHTLTFSKC